MNLFEQKFVLSEWNEKLEGKNVFVANDMNDYLNDELWLVPCKVRKGEENAFHGYNELCDDLGEFKYAYYDPNYNCKIAYLKGKVIQVFDETRLNSSWQDVSNPQWFEDCKYRIKPNGDCGATLTNHMSKNFESVINEIPLSINPCKMCVNAKNWYGDCADYGDVCNNCCFFYNSHFKMKSED